ncbi:hypothetical protein KH5H1_55010 [Corallococcus caeni]|uniref:cytochrome P450 n=1 Tax=Corallococcus caeni TaxID=3082388 RepID=UPI002957E90E|nr:hypothetical protein KH5H1_55010 [Corallococcus sp. KH5-1]
MTTARPSSPSIPGPSALPLLGLQGSLIKFSLDPVAHMREAHATYGNVVAFAKQDPKWVYAFGAENNQRVLTDNTTFHIPSMSLTLPIPPGSSLDRLNSGLITMNGERHKKQRRLIMPVFHKKHLDVYCEDMVRVTEEYISGWKVGQPLNIAKAMQHLALIIVGKTLFGTDSRTEASLLGGVIRKWIDTQTSLGVFAFPRDLPGTPYRRLLRLSETLEAHLLKKIEQKRANPQSQHDLLWLLMQARDEEGTEMTDHELIGQANNLFNGGHETSGNALGWTLFLLSQHPEILANVLEELKSVLRGGAPGVEHLGQLPLLEGCIKESLRLLPPGTYSMRVVNEPVELGAYTIPKGTLVILSIYMTHMLPELYPEPRKFKPERWHKAPANPYGFMTFSAGARRCIGAEFAMMEMKIVLAILLQRFSMQLDAGARIDRRVRLTLFPKRGIPMTLGEPGRLPVRAGVRGNIHEMVDLS